MYLPHTLPVVGAFLASQDVNFVPLIGGIEHFFLTSMSDEWAISLYHWVLICYLQLRQQARQLNWAEWWFLFLAFGNCLSGFDDLFIDIYYWTTYAMRRLKYPRKHFPLLSEEDLLALPQKHGAIFIAAWKEDDVIEEMLITNNGLINYQNYDFFVACYPNDEPTLNKVNAAASKLPNVVPAVNPKPGPSNKADNLNAAFLALKRREQELAIHYDFIVMHDPEDILHPLEMRLYNYLLHKRDPDMIQTPIFPLEVPWQHFTASSYMDEFAETHTKDIYVREWMRGFVPSAGVGTCIQRRVLDQLSDELGPAKIFNTESLTEDYDFGLRLRLTGGKAIFVRQLVWRTRDAQGQPLAQPFKEMITTRAHFPSTFYTALRQRTRWMVGIIFQNWKQFGWVGDVRTRWLLFHDRKGLWANTLVLLNYLFLLTSTFHMSLRWLVWPGMSPLLSSAWWIRAAFTICLLMMVNRVVQRAIATHRIYGWRQGFLSLPRLAWDNLINITVTFRAANQFITSELKGAKIAWDKTQHFFPTEGEVGGHVPNYLGSPQQTHQTNARGQSAAR
jgi:adsorption protein B